MTVSVMETFPRLDAVCDLMVALSREYAGLHRYDGVVQDLSPDGVRAGLARLGGPAIDDTYDEAFLSCAEKLLHVQYSDLELYRRNALPHLMNLDLAVYDREYAPAGERAEARRRHLAAWPDAIDAAVQALDRLPKPVAIGLLPATRGLAATLNADDPVEAAGLEAHARLLAHIEAAAAHGDPDASLGGDALAQLLGAMEAIDIDLAALTRIAESETTRLTELLHDACARYRADAQPRELIAELLSDHPDADGVLSSSTALTEEAIAWTAEHELVPYDDGVCVVERSPESRRWAMAMMAPAAPWEQDAPSFFHVTPPHPDWPAEAQEDWLSVFSATTLPAIAVHEVAPGHFSHARALLRAPTPVRRTLFSESFIEGWAHYAEELCVEEGFHADDPRFAIGVYLEALIRVTRLVSAIGIHTGAMDVDESARRFRDDAFLRGPGARAEAERATFDPSYGRYTWGKLVINELREQARKQWGDGFSLRRFHTAMLDLGSPPLGLLGVALERG
ncbi:MAG: DUF885 family protein [Actinomycetes bacterium]